MWTLTRDTVATHSYFVAMYAREIAVLINWNGDYADLLFRALTHDLDEIVTGDICGPAKHEIIDDKRAASYIDTKMRERIPFIMADLDLAKEVAPLSETTEAYQIIKAADKLDALVFLVVEKRLGNTVAASHIPRSRAIFEAAWRALPAPKEQLDELWNTVIVPAVRKHETKGGLGI